MTDPYLINFKEGSRILEIGGGENPLRDSNGNRSTINMDIVKSPNIDIVHDLGVFPWPIEDKSYDGIFAKYVLEHLSWHDIEKAIKEIYRILKNGGKVVCFLPNTLEQCRKIVDEGVNKGTVELLFGSQEFPNNAGAHKTGFSEEYAKKLFKDAGFNFVRMMPHPISSTDMILEAFKVDDIFEREYFEDGTIGYKEYRDFATHYSTARILMREKPESVLDIGCGRGYLVKLLEGLGVTAVGMDISKHCWHTRATDSFILWDATKIPWKIAEGDTYPKIQDKEFDICFSINFLEHIPENKLDDVIKEMARVSNRGLHGIHMTGTPFEELDPDLDVTHQISKSKEWWENKFKSIVPEYNVKIEHPRMLEYEKPELQPPITLMPQPTDNLVKLNLGSFLDMFYEGWINIDILPLHEFAKAQAYNFLQHDVTTGLPYKDKSVDIIMSNHMLEHITRDDGKKLLAECYRVLKSGGIIRFSVPDTKLITQKYMDGDINEYRYINVGVEQAEDDAEAYYSLLLSGHLTIFDEQSLTKMLENAGFKDIKKVGPFESRSEHIKKQTITTHPSVSLIIECIR